MESIHPNNVAYLLARATTVAAPVTPEFTRSCGQQYFYGDNARWSSPHLCVSSVTLTLSLVSLAIMFAMHGPFFLAQLNVRVLF